MKTIQEVAEITGLSRRVIQEYEKAGLAIKPKNKNKYGHLLYDTEEIERLRQLRLYRELGFGKSKIKSILENPSCNEKKEWGGAVKSLADKKAQVENLIAITQVMQETGIDFNSLISVFFEGNEDVCLDNSFYILGNILNISLSSISQDNCLKGIFTKEDTDTCTALFKQVIKSCENGKDASSEEVQNIIASMHKMISQVSSELILIFYWGALGFFPNNVLAADIDAAYGEGKSAYFYSALQTYFTVNGNNGLTNVINAAKNIEDLGRKQYKADSEEVQLEVGKIHQVLDDLSIFCSKTGLDMLREFGELCGSKVYIDTFAGAKKDTSGITSKAIQIYCYRVSNEKV